MTNTDKNNFNATIGNTVLYDVADINTNTNINYET